MKIALFFIDRPVFATVISIIIVMVGVLSYFNLPVEQYPQVVPPTIQVYASYPGANAKTVAETVATPIEQEVNGVENMLYMDSQSTDDGQMRLTITFKLGTDLDQAQVLVQNRVAVVEPKLPEEVRRLGITTNKNSPDLMLVVNLYSPNGQYDQTYIGNYAILHIRDKIRRIEGVGNVLVFGASEYAMRIWLNPDLMNTFNLTANDVLAAVRAQNVQVASGKLNLQPQKNQYGFEYHIETKGRLVKKEEFESIIVKSGENGRIVRLKDIGRVELGTQNYLTKGYLDKYPAVALPIYQRPGTNALATAQEIIKTMKSIAKDFPPGITYDIAYNPTLFVQQSIDAVFHTIYEAIALVVLVILIFLQTWRASVIPIVAIPVSLIGTFAVMQAIGFSLNYLTLFGLVLAIGIVVDDAIVVVENMERNIQAGMNPRDAARKTMTEVGSALVAMGLVLIAVFLPTVFLEGISGRFYQQFGTTLAVATAISVFVSLTLTPTMAVLLLRAHHETLQQEELAWWKKPVYGFLHGFNRLMEGFSRQYGKLVANITRKTALMIIVYGIFISITLLLFVYVPRGFIPRQDQGYFIVAVQLPAGASLSRTDAVINKAVNKILAIPGIAHTVSFTGFSGATFTNSSNAGAIFTPLLSFEERQRMGINYNDILKRLRQELSTIKEALIVVIPPPPVRGIGNAGGFKMMLQDRGGRGLDVLMEAAATMVNAANQEKATTSVFTFFENSTPRLHLKLDREKVERLNVPYANVVEALEVYLGSVFINEFNYLGRTFRVIAQADSEYRHTEDDILRIKVKSNNGDMVPIGSVAQIENTVAPSRMPRFNLYPAIDLQGDVSPGYSSDEALATMEKLAQNNLPDGIGYEWTEIAYQQKMVGNTAAIAFTLGVIFIFLVLAAQYESWSLPLAVILIVPMCLFSSMLGVKILGMENNIMTQIGFLVLIGLASKNAILIVEFARQLENRGYNLWKAAIQAAKLRLRPILMTSFAFILGVFPLIIATGAGAEMRRALGVAVFSGMLGVTFFGLVFTPLFYVLISRLSKYKKRLTKS
ncbi:efflux RND transporter permease subunit [Legionella pneumophila]|uniref:Efflux pump membrane transporter n=1 Tax=Legionella pneumophila subsp. pascullei TaxID=91890 RepID=A0AAX2IYL8_LEGPN|nr:multidrug efflux RND transporter permease subunit [Legionella pneumophila]AMP89252.1 multidrug efflux RND transporter permease subunit [Legionella pneumophila subsp. pascullei]AMP93080.1 RND transporter [Legionella pneumophila subsp. pascullei]AMP96046.1 RND transporter [Legionella pneumophila subsp. pascullei]SQG90983.1 multidrug-efflux system transmembrane protein [Legionella pneumophila subsp. pascullei]VEH07528.1 multidrug-efflux system transmembrane protein [Legionella pneumophila subs